MIRITGGKYRSRLLETPSTNLTKPTMDKVRAGIFSAIGDFVVDSVVLDLFAGSGSYGFEALSRGAKKVVFCDKSRDAFQVLRNNAKALKEEENISINFGDSLKFLTENTYKFDMIFVDPPYKLDVYEDIVNIVLDKELLNENGILILESERELNIDETKFKGVRIYKYSLAKVYILRK